MFLAYLTGTSMGGCGDFMGCDTNTVELPEGIKTLEEAISYIKNEDEEGCINYHGLELIDSITIYEVISSHEVDLKKIGDELRRKEKEEQAREERLNDEAEYERLKRILNK